MLRLAGLPHPPGYTDLIRGQCAGPSGLFAAGAGGLPGDGGSFVDQLALVLSQRGEDAGHHPPDWGRVVDALPQ
jgi:hypothetical protein